MGSSRPAMWQLIPSTLLAFTMLVPHASTAQDFEARSLGKISSPNVDCGYWTRNTVLVGPTTKATVTSQLVGIRKCAVLFKLAGKCTQMKMACSNFNVHRGPDRWFSLGPLGKGIQMETVLATGSSQQISS